MLGSAEEAEDAVQHTFFAAYNALTGSETPIHLRAWLFTIARNRCYSMLRARREHPVAELDDQPTEGLATLVQRRQDLRDLVVDLQKLPTAQREALVLAEMDALSHEQIAAVLGVPREKVKALVYQARESLLASRAARETDCAEIREQLSNLHGGALRRTNLRRHLRECQGCREFRHSMERQRRHLQMIIPVVPTLALKDLVIGSTIGGSAMVGVAGGGALAGSVLKGSALKGIVGALLAGMGTAGTIVAVRDLPNLVGADLFHSSNRLAPRSPAAPFKVTPQHTRSAADVASTGVSAATTPTVLGGHGSVSQSAAASLSVLAPLPAAGNHSGAVPSAHKLSPTPPPSIAGQGKPAPPPAAAATPAAPATTAPYLGSSAYGSGSQTSGGGTRGGYSATGSTSSPPAVTSSPSSSSSSQSSGPTSNARHGDGGGWTPPAGTTRSSSSSSSASSNTGTSRGSTAPSGSSSSTSQPSVPSQSAPAATPTAPSTGSAGGGGSGTSGGGGAWSGGGGGASNGPHGR